MTGDSKSDEKNKKRYDDVFNLSVVNPERLIALRQFPDENASISHEERKASLEEAIKGLDKTRIRALKLCLYDSRRRILWKRILELKAGQDLSSNVQLYNDTIETLYPDEASRASPPPFQPCIDPKLTSTYGLNEVGKASVRRIVHVIAYNSPELNYCPLIFPLAAIFRHFLSEDESYAFIMCLLGSRMKSYIPQSRQQEDIYSLVILEIASKFGGKAFRNLETDIGTSEEVEKFFRRSHHWIFSKLPLTHLVQLIDYYLLEGEKILIRVVLALLKSFSKGSGRTESIRQNGLYKAFDLHIKDIKTSPSHLMSKAFSIRGFSQSDIKRAKIHAEVGIKTRFPSGGRAQSLEILPNSDGVDGSLTSAQLRFIWKYLPSRVALCPSIRLAFSTNEHGVSISTFYSRIEPYEQTLLVVKTREKEVFGAYCPMSWKERNCNDDRGSRQRYFGNGETFLFVLEPSMKVYPWVGPGDGINKVEDHTRELYISGTHENICIGGGKGSGLFIDNTLTLGSSETCVTFDNEPLASKRDFEISVVEVYGLYLSEE
eukprot:TRINITY_DN4607_c0_g1_i1.p1 TRINITY_DN4607_c0_g1~~TRINITY_DN4607_c0_g1_i1.p1  ORF type:complete len:545 (+),score=96.93 TRINITY_DN4607_c0_g1_i1:97-1731(+)